jgi:hypothetical protein
MTLAAALIDAIVAGLAVVVALLALLVVGLLRSHAVVLRKLEDLGAGVGDPTGRDAPFRTRAGVPTPGDAVGRVADVEGADLDGGGVALRVVGSADRTLLFFLSSGCLTCRAFWDALRQPGSLQIPDGVRPIVVAKDTREESLSVLQELAPPNIPLVLSSAAWSDYEVPGSPYVVLVDGPTSSIIGEGTGLDWPQVAALLAQASGDLAFVGARTAPRGNGAAREQEVDDQLRAAGITPGHASLYPTAPDGAPEERG